MIPQTIKRAISSYYKKAFAEKSFHPGVTPVPVSGKVFDDEELEYGVDAVLDGWWTEGRFVEEFEKKFREYLGVKYVNLVNSGSSANLVALSALSSRVFGDRAIKPGDEVITAACGFPTTVNPILQNGLVPVFIDSSIRTKNPTMENIKKAITKKTRVIMMAHTLGNPLPLDGISDVLKKHNLWFIEDACDGLGGTYKGKMIGTFGHIATFSFYPAHQITMGEGGAAVTNNPLIHQAIRQFRDWGRDCWCDTGCDNTCGKRFGWQMGELPFGYDHKYIYSQIGFNLKLTDMQAAIGLAQLRKLPEFVRARRKNFSLLLKGLRDLPRSDEFFLYTEPEEGANPSWFGFMIVVRDGVPFTRLELMRFLDGRKIGIRTLFGGNLLKHPAYRGRKDVRIAGKLFNANTILNNGFWIGVYPGITRDMLKYIIASFKDFQKQFV